MGRLFIIAGLVTVAIGSAIQFAPWLVNWFGELPGDINYKSEDTRIFVPIVSMLLLSVLASLILYSFGVDAGDRIEIV
jgi:hypothetical protein